MITKVSSHQKAEFNASAIHPLQSWEWGEFREKTGNEVVRLARVRILQNGKQTLEESTQIIFSLIPHTNFKIGTVIRGPKPSNDMLEELKQLGNKENAIFIKLEPFVATGNTDGQYIVSTKENEKNSIILIGKGAIKGKTLFTPTSFWIDLTKSEEELLKGFHGKTRYNIRYAQRQGVEVVEDNSNKAFEKYLDLTRETVERQGFYSHTEKYHRLMWKYLHTIPNSLNSKPLARLLTAKYKGEILTTWIIFVWHDFLYYPYGASTDKYKNLQANSLMMWEAIRFGKNLGLKTFDLWGREAGKGFTKFKEGFNPSVVEFLGTWDLPTSTIYWPYRAAEFLRWQYLRAKNKFTMPGF